MILSELKDAVTAAALTVSHQQDFLEGVQARVDQGDQLVTVYVDGVLTKQPIGAFIETSKLMLASYEETYRSLNEEHNRLQGELDSYVAKQQVEVIPSE